LGSRDVTGHVTIRLPGVDILWVVHSDHASIWHRYVDMAPQILDARTWTRKERWKKGKRKRKGREMKWKGKGKVERKKEGKEKGRRKVEGKELKKGWTRGRTDTQVILYSVQ